MFSFMLEDAGSASLLDGLSSGSRVLSIASRRSAPGRPFAPKEEARLGPALEALAVGCAPSGTVTLLLRELVVPYGVIDLAALHVRPARVAARIGAGIPPILNDVDSGIVSTLTAATPISVQGLVRRLSWPTSTIERRLVGLRRSGAVTAQGAGFVRHRALEPLGRLTGLEAKVRDWQGALQQVRTYSLWCDRVGATLLEAVSDWQAITERFREASAGLAVRYRWSVSPPLQTLERRRRLLGSEHFFAGLVGMQPSARAPRPSHSPTTLLTPE